MQQTGLVHYNLDKDLYLQKKIDDVTVHLNTKPFKASIKNTNTKAKKTAKLFLGVNMKSTENLLTSENINSNNTDSIQKMSHKMKKSKIILKKYYKLLIIIIMIKNHQL